MESLPWDLSLFVFVQACFGVSVVRWGAGTVARARSRCARTVLRCDLCVRQRRMKAAKLQVRARALEDQDPSKALTSTLPWSFGSVLSLNLQSCHNCRFASFVALVCLLYGALRCVALCCVLLGVVLRCRRCASGGKCRMPNSSGGGRRCSRRSSRRRGGASSGEEVDGTRPPGANQRRAKTPRWSDGAQGSVIGRPL